MNNFPKVFFHIKIFDLSFNAPKINTRLTFDKLYIDHGLLLNFST